MYIYIYIHVCVCASMYMNICRYVSRFERQPGLSFRPAILAWGCMPSIPSMPRCIRCQAFQSQPGILHMPVRAQQNGRGTSGKAAANC